jgi:hypothetical protein
MSGKDEVYPSARPQLLKACHHDAIAKLSGFKNEFQPGEIFKSCDFIFPNECKKQTSNATNPQRDIDSISHQIEKIRPFLFESSRTSLDKEIKVFVT